MAAHVTAEDRRETGFKNDGSFPMATASQIRSAIKLRHHGKGHSAAQVLAKAAGAIQRLKTRGKISPAEAKRLLARVQEARVRDRKT